MIKRMLSLVSMLIAVVMLVACASAPAAQPVASASGKKFDPKPWAGTYKGTWTNQTTGSTGPVTASVTLDEAKKEATITIDLDGPYLGLADPPPATFTAKYDDVSARVEGNNVLFGEFKVTVEADGKFVGTFKKIAGGTIPEMTYMGQLGDNRLDSDYTVKFADGKTATAILRTTKQ